MQRTNPLHTIEGLQSVIDSLAAIVAVLDTDGTIIAVNRAWERFARENGNPPADRTGVGVNYLAICRSAAVDDPVAAQALAGIEGVLRGATPKFTLEHPCHSSSRMRWFLMHAGPWLADFGGVVISYTDITERKQAEESLYESCARYRDLVETVEDWIWEVDASGAYTYNSPRVRDILGYEPDELLGKTAFDLMPPEEARRVEVIFRSLAAERKPIVSLENTCVHRDGRRILVETSGKPFFDAGGVLLGYRGVDRDITVRKRSEEALVARTRQLEAVRAVTTEISRELDLPALLRLIIRRAAELVGAAAGTIYLWDERIERLIPQAWHGYGEWKAEAHLRLDEGVAGAVARQREGLIVNDYRTSPYAVPLILQRSEIIAVLAEPLLYQQRLLGVIGISNHGSGRPFTEEDREVLRLLAVQAAIAIENARLHRSALRRGAELEALLRATGSVMSGLDLQVILQRIVVEAAQMAGTPHVSVMLVDKAARVLRLAALAGDPVPVGFQVHLGADLSGVVAETGRLVFSPDSPNDPRNILAERDRRLGFATYLGLPIRIREEILGVLTFDTTVPRDYTMDELAYLTSFADHAAIAIENAHLYEAAQRELDDRTHAEAALIGRTRQLDAIRAVSVEITRELDLFTLLRLILRRAVELVGAAGGAIYFWDEATRTLMPQMWSGSRDAEWMQDARMKLGEGLVGQVAERRVGLIVNDYRNWPSARPSILERTEISAALAEPLLYRDRLVGVVSLDNGDTGRIFSEQDCETLSLFAAQAAIAIENARLLTAAVRRGEELEALLRATASVMSGLDLQGILDRIVAETAQITGCSHVKVLLVDRKAGVLRVGAIQGTAMSTEDQLPLGIGHSGVVAKTGQPLFSEDAPHDPRNAYADRDRELGIVTYLGLPIKIRGEILGVLSFNTTVPRQYGPEELAYLTSFADHAAIAIENARLFAELNQSYQTLQRAQEEMVRSEKLRALGQMAAGIAHDLNNMLAAVLGQVDLLRLRVVNPEIQEALGILETAASDGAHVVRRLQDFARQRASSPLTPLDLRRAVSEALEITRPRWKDEQERRGVVIQVQNLLEDCPPILGHAPEIREVLTNLILNAVDAMPRGGTLTLTARQVLGPESTGAGERGGRGTESRGAEEQGNRGEDASRQFVELSMTDTGIGMSEAVRQRIFEPFFTTKGGHGTGLGLSVVYGIMERHGGRIEVTSGPGRGTTVALQFRGALQTGDKAPAGPRPLTAALRILVIDDDAAVRETVVGLLRAAGHQVIEADGGAVGLQRFDESLVDLVVTDLGMPEVTGWDVARAVKARSPKLPVILITGWGDQPGGGAEPRDLVDRVLGKPFRVEELLQTIAEVTDVT
jgi:PAS domain S-box-containing protein